MYDVSRTVEITATIKPHNYSRGIIRAYPVPVSMKFQREGSSLPAGCMSFEAKKGWACMHQ